MIIQQLQIVYF